MLNFTLEADRRRFKADQAIKAFQDDRIDRAELWRRLTSLGYTHAQAKAEIDHACQTCPPIAVAAMSIMEKIRP